MQHFRFPLPSKPLQNSVPAFAAMAALCLSPAVFWPHQAQAADALDPAALPVPLPISERPASEPWTGFYGGIHGGIGAFNGRAMDWGNGVFDNPDGDFDLAAFAGLAGVQAGVNRQVGALLYGIEADWAWTGFDEQKYFEPDGTGWDHYVRAEMDWLATLRGRLGLAHENAMVYVTGGLALARLDHCGNDDAPCSIDGEDDIAWSGTRPGLALGAGVEARLSENWSIKGEYLYVDLAGKTIAYDTTQHDNPQEITFGADAHLVRLGVNYHPGGLPLAAPLESGAWTGVYGGLHGGVGAFNGRAMDWGDEVFDNPDGDIDLAAFAGLAGVQAGVNRQVGALLYGLEADWAWTGFDREKYFDPSSDWDHYVRAEMDWLATLRGRLGLAHENAMVYVTGGLALARLDHCGNDDDDAPCSIDGDDNIAWSGTRPGLALGAGVEARLSENWSLKGEYLYVDLAGKTIAYDTSGDLPEEITFGADAHLVRLGVNRRFGGP